MFQLSKVLSRTLVAFIFLSLLAGPSVACVGKTLVIGTTGSVQQDVLSNMIAQLISERTGTTVKVVAVGSSAEAHEALLKADLDMYVEYTGVGQVNILHAEPLQDSSKLYKSVKDHYNQKLNLIWLKPLGFDAAQAVGLDLPAEAAPVVRKDTLKKFPALARLINKLGGKIDAATMARLEEEAGKQGSKKIARSFLKQKRLI